nr:MAG TPA: hypothetical protein [Caudoviricetes sp.]
MNCIQGRQTDCRNGAGRKSGQKGSFTGSDHRRL